MMGAAPRRTGWVPFAAIAAATLALDALTKLWAVVHLEVRGHGALAVIPGHVELVVARNPGAAFSLLRDAPETLRRPFFFAVTIAACVAVALAYRRLDPSRVAARLALPLVLGGALGNLVDRIRDGTVVDFIQAHARFGAGADRFWPTFNVADVAICLGAALLALDAFGLRRRTDAPAT